MLRGCREYTAKPKIPLVAMALVGCLPPPLKRFYYRLRGATIGRRVRLGMFSYIDSPNIVLGDDVHIAPFVFIRAYGKCCLGARARIQMFSAIETGVLQMEEDSGIGEQVVVGGMQTPRSALVIGRHSKLFAFCVINPTEPVHIGEAVCVGGGTYLFTHSSWPSALDGFPITFAPVTIKDRAYIAWRSFVLPGITIGEDAVVGAASVVTKDVAPRTMVAGSPARLVKTGGEYIKPLSPQEQHERVKTWLGEFHEQCRHEQRPCEYAAQNHMAVMRLLTRPRSMAVVYWRAEPVVLPEDTVIAMSFDALSPEHRLSLTRRHIAWFDLARRECALSPHPLWEEFRHFMLRYGLRFNVVSEC